MSAENKTFEDAARPLIAWLNANGHPHMTVIVDQIHAELLEGRQSFVTHEYARDAIKEKQS